MSKINRSEFIRDILSKNKKAKYKDVVSAWQKAEYPAEQMPSSSLYYLVKPKSKKSKKTVKNDNKKDQYISIEKQLDTICILANELKDTNVVEEIRKVRRLASKKILAI